MALFSTTFVLLPRGERTTSGAATRDLQPGLGGLGAGAGPKAVVQQGVDVDTVGHVRGRELSRSTVLARDLLLRGGGRENEGAGSA